MDPKPGQTRDDMAAELEAEARAVHESEAAAREAEEAGKVEAEAEEHRVAELERQVAELENRREGDPTGDPSARLAHVRAELKAAKADRKAGGRETTSVEAPEQAVTDKPRSRQRATKGTT